MKKLLLSMTALAALAGAAAPAAAQSWRDDDRYDRYDRYESRDRYAGYSDRLERQIERAMDRRQISHREGRRLLAELQAIDDLDRRYREDGRLSGWEAADLNRRKDRLAQRLDQVRGDRDYGYRDDWRR